MPYSLLISDFKNICILNLVRFLKYLELIEKINDGIKITDLGKKILYGSCKDELKQINFTSQKIIKLEDIEKYNIPTSIFLKYLENTKGFHPLKLDDHKETKIFWKKNAQVNNTNEEIKVEYLNKRNKILDIMRAVSHPITTQSVSEELEKRNEHLGNHIVYCLLLEIKKEGIVIEDGESWKYPIHSRIFDLFQEFSDNSFDIDSVLKKCVIPKSEVEFVEQKLREYEKLMYVTEINGEWISSKGADKKINQIRKQEVREAVLTILNEVHNISKNDIVKDRYTMNTSGNYLGSKLISQVSKIFQNREIRIVCSDQMIKDEIDSMVVDGIITKTDEYYQKKIN